MSTFHETPPLNSCFSDREAILRYPEALRNLPCCVWRLEADEKGRMTKIPYNPENGLHASVSQPTTFSDLKTALEAMRQGGYNGVGLRVTDKVGCIDIDDSVSDDGKLSDNAEAVLRMLPEAFVELSPSGHGLHLYFRIPEGFRFDREDYYINNRTNGMEIYLAGETRRFITVTGKKYREGSLRVAGDELKTFCETFMRKPAPRNRQVAPPEGGSILSDEEVLRRCCSGKGGKTFERYYNGNWQKPSSENWSQSEADLSVCRRLAFFTRGDQEQMDRLFRKSGLWRKKWDEPRGASTYGQMTVTKAIQGCDAFYEPEKGASAESETADSPPADPEAELTGLLSRDLSVDEMMSQPFLSLAAWAMEKNPQLYIHVREKISSKKIGIRYFEKQLKKLENSKRDSSEQIPKKPDLTGIDVGELVIPPRWIVDDSGIRYRNFAAGRLEEVPISVNPVFITAKMITMGEYSEKLKLTYRRNGKYISCTGPRSELLNKNTIVKYANLGLPVNSGNAGPMANYLADLENANELAIPIQRCVKRAGWFDAEFYPYGMRDAVQCQEDSSGSAGLMEALHTKGQEEVWMDLARQARTYPFARCILAASFASPLLKILSCRIIYMHVWYDTLSGKTAVVKLALAAWGDPEKMMGSYNATLYGLEQRCAMLHHLPVGLDELQSLIARGMSADRIVYHLGNGQGKTQGKPDCGIRSTGSWRNCILSTGEQPISTDSSMDGVNTRLMEINACPLMNPDGSVNLELGQRMHREAAMNYGFAGEKLIRFLQNEIIDDSLLEGKIPPKLEEDLRTVQEKLAREAPERVRDHPQMAATAVLCLADTYASRGVFGESAEQALEEAVSMGVKILEVIDRDRPTDTVTAAWEYLIGWFSANRNQFIEMAADGTFINNGRDPLFGLYDRENVYVIAQVMNKALEDRDYSVRKIIKGFQRKKYIDCAYEPDGKIRYQILKRIYGIPTRVYALRRACMDKEGQREFITTEEPVPEQLRIELPQ